MKIDMPKNVKLIIKILQNNGYEAYVVGGCVRDAILGKEPNDWDITTSAMPEDVKRIFHRTIDTGIQHGTVTVLMEQTGYEVTTYRIDGEYEDGRHPKDVVFTRNLIEDLKRRDFTINAMAYNDEDGLVDEFDGIGDLNRKIIRCVGNPFDRFNEDALRILRAVRFAASLGFEIDDETKRAVTELAHNLSKISKERIQVELDKLLLSDHPDMLEEACVLGITKEVLPETDRLSQTGRLSGILQMLKRMEKNHYMRWAAVFAYSDKRSTHQALKELKFDNHTVNICSRMVDAVNTREIPTTEGELRKDIYEVGEDIYEWYLKFLGEYLHMAYPDTWEDISEEYGRVCNDYQAVIERGDCTSLKKLAVNGKDLIQTGQFKGAAIGEELERLLYLVFEHPEWNQREILLDKIQKQFP